ncbi:MAG TPA: hypothetical protein VM598_10890 [Bdellovibrionota bacterium]|nr:hypothetical protein [Bdellovibrionota bacterium]
METRSSTRSERLQAILVTLLCFSGAGLAGWALFVDMTASGRAGSGTPMAMVERRESSVRRKAAGTFVWNNVNLADDLYRRDLVQTSAESSALIRFSDNTLLEVGENSLVVIDDLKDFKLGVMRGNLVVRSAQGDRKISIDEDGKAKVEEISLRLLKPEPLARFFAAERVGREIEFAWASRGQAAQGAAYKLEISQERAFPPGATRVIESREAAARMALVPGRWFWRVSAGASGSSETRQFRVAQAAALTPVFPVGGQRVPRWGADRTLQFRWATSQIGVGIEAQSRHFLEVADDSEFRIGKRESQLAADAGAAVIDAVPAGRRYWRIRSQFGDLVLLSRAESFVAEEGKDLGLTQTYPATGERLELSRAAVRFAWDSDGPAQSFQIEIESADGKPVASTTAGARSYAWSAPAAGQYRWRVTARAGTQSLGQTAWRNFSVQEGTPLALLEPAADQELRYWDSPPAFSFKWSEDSLAARSKGEYRVELSKEPDFKGAQLVRTRETTLASAKVRLEPGTWFWRVSIVDATGAVSKSSEARKLAYGPHPVLKGPGLTNAQERTVYNPLEDEKSPVLSWTPVEGSEAYEITLVSPARGPASGAPAQAERVILKKTIEETRLEVDASKLKPGEYVWRVRAVDRAKRLGEASAPARLEVTYGDPLDAPEVTSSEVQ